MASGAKQDEFDTPAVSLESFRVRKFLWTVAKRDKVNFVVLAEIFDLIERADFIALVRRVRNPVRQEKDFSHE